ncbi:MAG: hypothetical protein BJ554DRAFT_3643 [Olpidium bornovanus]|uniref:Uncharacterized protein n=1 Tax=Olpidium bornovanus TaxID=278681 RepID=A0A8H7ZNF7_9FUNG|nr:MAG: hypothetical protein BJ554DRAFT_3643 [Olpidium bornovanus]
MTSALRSRVRAAVLPPLPLYAAVQRLEPGGGHESNARSATVIFSFLLGYGMIKVARVYERAAQHLSARWQLLEARRPPHPLCRFFFHSWFAHELRPRGVQA